MKTRLFFVSASLVLSAHSIAAMPVRCNEPAAPFYYRPELVTRAKENAAKYSWARGILRRKVVDARRWSALSDEELVSFVPSVTPLRPCDCPNCGESWGGYIWSWKPGRPEVIVCRWCKKAITTEDYPDDRTFTFPDPKGVDRELPYYEKAGKRSFIRSRIAYHKFTHAVRMVQDLTEAYLLTGREEFARKAVPILTRMGEVFPGYVLKRWDGSYRLIFDRHPKGRSGKLSGWHYEDAILVGQLARCYDALRCWGMVPAASRKMIEQGLFEEAGAILTYVPPEDGIVNDHPQRYAGVASIARVLDDPKMMRWVTNSKSGFLHFVSTHWLPDGHWCERAPSYGLMAIKQLHITPWVMQGYCPPSSVEAIDWRNHSRIERAHAALFELVWPDGTLPAMNDSHAGDKPPAFAAEINYAWYGGEQHLVALNHAYNGRLLQKGDETAFWLRDPDINKALEEIDRKEAESLGRYWPDLNVTLLRAGSATNRAAVLLEHGEYAGGHSHLDRLNLSYWALGREMASDLGYVYWGHQLRDSWLNKTLSHNTVLVDGRDQSRPAVGTAVFHHLNGRVEGVEAVASNVYPNVGEYRRTLVLVADSSHPPILLDIFRVRGGSTHDWSFHAETDRLDVPGVPLAAGDPLGTAGPYQLLKKIRSGMTDDPWTAVWRWEDGTGLRLWMAGVEGTRVSVAAAPGQRTKKQEGRELPFLIVRRTGPELTSTFVAVHEPFRDEPAVAAVSVAQCGPQTEGWPVIVEMVVRGKTWWIGSKLTTDAWTAVPSGERPLDDGRLTVVQVERKREE